MNVLNTAKTLVLGLALVVGLSSIPALAEGGGDSQERHGCGIMKQLNLSEEQQAQLKSMRDAHKGDMGAKKAEWQAAKEKMKAMKESGDTEGLKQMREEMKQKREAAHQKMEANLQGVLTAEQFAQFKALKEQCKANWKKEHGNKRHGDKQDCERSETQAN